MSRHSGSQGHWHQPSRKGKGHKGSGRARALRASGTHLDKAAFETLLRRLNIGERK